MLLICYVIHHFYCSFSLTPKIIKVTFLYCSSWGFAGKQMRALKGNGEIDPQTKRNTLFLLSDDDRLPVIDIHPFSKLIWHVENWRRNCFYFAMMIHGCKQMWVLQTNWWTGQEPKEKMFLLAMMKCCLWSMCVLQTNWWRGREPKEKLFVLCDDDLLLLMDLRTSKTFRDKVENRRRKCLYFSDDDLLLLMDLRPSKTFTDRWRTEGETVSTLQWWTVATDRCASFKEVDGQVKNRSSDWFYFGLMICFGNQMPLRIHRSATMKRVVYMGDTD